MSQIFFFNISNLRHVRRGLSLSFQARISYWKLLGKTESSTQRALVVSLETVQQKALLERKILHSSERLVIVRHGWHSVPQGAELFMFPKGLEKDYEELMFLS